MASPRPSVLVQLQLQTAPCKRNAQATALNIENPNLTLHTEIDPDLAPHPDAAPGPILENSNKVTHQPSRPGLDLMVCARSGVRFDSSKKAVSHSVQRVLPAMRQPCAGAAGWHAVFVRLHPRILTCAEIGVDPSLLPGAQTFSAAAGAASGKGTKPQQPRPRYTRMPEGRRMRGLSKRTRSAIVATTTSAQMVAAAPVLLAKRRRRRSTPAPSTSPSTASFPARPSICRWPPISSTSSPLPSHYTVTVAVSWRPAERPERRSMRCSPSVHAEPSKTSTMYRALSLTLL